MAELSPAVTEDEARVRSLVPIEGKFWSRSRSAAVGAEAADSECELPPSAENGPFQLMVVIIAATSRRVLDPLLRVQMANSSMHAEVPLAPVLTMLELSR